MPRSPDEVSRWIDHLEICDVFARFAEGLDSRDFDLYRSIMTDEIEVDYSSWRPTEPKRMVAADDWAGRARRTFPGLDASQHSITNIRTFIDGDTAIGTGYVVAEHFLTNSTGDNSFAIGGYYRNQFVRTGQGWKLSGINLNVRWQRGNRAVMTLANERAATLLTQT